MARLYRCLICQPPAGLDFEDDRPLEVVRCPACRRGVPAIAPRVAVHFLYPDESGPIVGLYGLRYRCACQPDLVHLNGMPASDFTPTVSCLRCRQHPKYREYLVQGVLNAGINVERSPCH